MNGRDITDALIWSAQDAPEAAGPAELVRGFARLAAGAGIRPAYS